MPARAIARSERRSVVRPTELTARDTDADGCRLAPGDLLLPLGGFAVVLVPAQPVRAGKPLPRGHQRRPVRQSQIVLDAMRR